MKPAIFNTEMVRAILDDRKTNTRRPFSKYIEKVIKYAQLLGEIGSNGVDRPFSNGDIKYLLEFAPYKVGDIIYVRETWSDYPKNYVWYKADFPLHWDAKDTEHGEEVHIEADNVKWKPSIYMPKEYARLFLRVKDVRIERLNEISEGDAVAEGIEVIDGVYDGHEYHPVYFKNYMYGKNDSMRFLVSAQSSFKTLWESIYGDRSFDNRYVWVTEFEQISKEEAING
ncbi:hypothetical protein E0765_06240 [Sulfuricurvum sp. IAE1]|uniref:hypothetical protein n=1 Tax=Sulfuricurvum sp. IAE1 TaxID=2546102 RepID=UPI001053D99E|nr:hypothetical protein [Sulfuricurvum sp. IAE1]TDA64312.1 hypothetical protein E0765_06240 [Sulfuricurvum sp. IAE1]